MAVLNFTVNEVIGIFKENSKFPDILKDIKYKDGLLQVTLKIPIIGTEVKINFESKLLFSDGVLQVNYEPKNKISEFLDLAGVLDLSIDKSIQNVEFVKKEKII